MARPRVAGWPRALRDWSRRYDTVVWDRWLAALFTVLAFAPELSAVYAQIGDLPRRPADVFAVVLMLAQTVPLAVRGRRPAVCLAVVGLSFATYEILSYPPQFGSVTVYIALYSAGVFQERFRRGTAVAATAGYGVLVVTVTVLGSPDRPAAFLIFYLLLAACWTVGAVVRRRQAEETERRRLAAAAATAAERARIARELHDVVTHHVTAMVVQAGATQYVAESPDRVVTALTTIGESGRRALAELRALLDMLDPAATDDEAADDEAAEPSPRRALAAGTVRDLVEQARSGGQPVELAEDGDQPALPAAVQLAVYRVVQEGLTNAAKYAAGQPSVVRVAYRDGRVEVEVTNSAAPGPSPGGVRRDLSGGSGLSGGHGMFGLRGLSGGRGLAGLRERVAILGGELTAGEQPDGRFRVRAVLPVA